MRLTLSDFRCYAALRLEVDDRPVVLAGPNGAGKNNLLEAISFLVPAQPGSVATGVPWAAWPPSCGASPLPTMFE